MSLLPHRDNRRERDRVCVCGGGELHILCCVQMCVCVVGRLVGVFCPGSAVSTAEAGTRLDRSQISLSALEQLCLCVD